MQAGKKMRAFRTFISNAIAIVVVAPCLVVHVRAWSPQSRVTERRDFLDKVTSGAVKGGAVVASTIAWTPLENDAVWAADETTGTTISSRNSKIYSPSQGSLVGQVHVITGASTGLGLESSKRLAAAGATVVCTVRTPSKGEQTLQEIRDYLGRRGIENENAYFLTLNLDDLESVRTFPDRYKKLMGEKKITVLMNNAGLAIVPQRELTRDGYERIFQSNHLGPFALTAGLFPYLDRAGARIVNVSSQAHQFVGQEGLDLGNLNGELEYAFDGWGAYSNTKLENILFSQELQRRADAAGLDWLTVTSLHPGVVGTDLWRNTYVGKTPNNDERSTSSLLKRIASSAFYGSTLTTEEGANTQVWLAAADGSARIQKGAFYDEHRKVQMLQAFARDETKAKELWEVSEKLSRTRFQVE